MRVISGTARGKSLASVPGDSTRPITDRVKSALFSILTSQDMVAGRRYLDLFGGTGAVGIEALSRGAAQVVFCERDRAALRALRANLESTGLGGHGQVLPGDAFAFLAGGQALAGSQALPFDVIYIAPPQYEGLWLRALRALDARPGLLAASGQAVIQIFPKEWTETTFQHLALLDHRQYGSTALYFFGKVQAKIDTAPVAPASSEGSSA